MLRRMTSSMDEDIDNQLPETNFEKVASIVPDVPAKQYRSLIQSMCESNQFQKNIIKKTLDISIPRYDRTQIKKRELFQDYEVLRAYSNFTCNKDHFKHRKFGSRNSSKNAKQSTNGESWSQPQSLAAIVQSKKNKLLIEQSILSKEQIKVMNILNNREKRTNIFEEALLIERLYDIQILKEDSKKKLKDTLKVPDKLKGIHPRHMRVGSEQCKTEEDFFRKKYVWKQRKLQFYGHAYKIQKSSLYNKKKENSRVIETLMKFNEKLCDVKSQSNYRPFNPEDSEEEVTKHAKKQNRPVQIYEQDLKIKRLFLKYCSCEADDPEEMYTIMGYQQLTNFLTDFSLTHYLERKQLKAYIKELARPRQKQRAQQSVDKQSIRIKLFDFLQILYLMSSFYEKQEQQNEDCVKLNDFLEQKIWSLPDKATPSAWIKLNKLKSNQKTCKLLKISGFEQVVSKVFAENINNNSSNKDQSEPLLIFNDIVEIAWKAKLFPISISKKYLRFVFLYNKTSEAGINMEEFKNMWIIIGLTYGKGKDTERKIKWVTDHLRK